MGASYGSTKVTNRRGSFVEITKVNASSRKKNFSNTFILQIQRMDNLPIRGWKWERSLEVPFMRGLFYFLGLF